MKKQYDLHRYNSVIIPLNRDINNTEIYHYLLGADSRYLDDREIKMVMIFTPVR
ncbi:hypothetical protein SAMN04487898_105143 [Pedobacter sp. ok626]|nr:hypothetical protein SAMN04487898_105143 [Pedobacter sp. ok626]